MVVVLLKIYQDIHWLPALLRLALQWYETRNGRIFDLADIFSSCTQFSLPHSESRQQNSWEL